MDRLTKIKEMIINSDPYEILESDVDNGQPYLWISPPSDIQLQLDILEMEEPEKYYEFLDWESELTTEVQTQGYGVWKNGLNL